MRRAPLQQQALSCFAELFDNAGPQHVQNARLCVRQLPAGDARAQVCLRPRCLPRLQRAQHLQKLHGLTQTTLSSSMLRFPGRCAVSMASLISAG